MPEGISLELLVAIGGIGALFVAHWIDRVIESRRKKRNACEALMRELKDTNEALNTDKHPMVIREPDIHYRSAFLNEDVYLGILHSEVFTEFESSTQNSLSNFYIKIRLRNKELAYLSDHRDQFFLDDTQKRTFADWTTKIRQREYNITMRDEELRNSLELIKSMLQEEIP